MKKFNPEDYFIEDGKFYRWIVRPEDFDNDCDSNYEDNSESEELTEAQYYKSLYDLSQKENEHLYADIRTLVLGEKDKKWFEQGQVKMKYIYLFNANDIRMFGSRDPVEYGDKNVVKETEGLKITFTEPSGRYRDADIVGDSHMVTNEDITLKGDCDYFEAENQRRDLIETWIRSKHISLADAFRYLRSELTFKEITEMVAKNNRPQQ